MRGLCRPYYTSEHALWRDRQCAAAAMGGNRRHKAALCKCFPFFWARQIAVPRRSRDRHMFQPLVAHFHPIRHQPG